MGHRVAPAWEVAASQKMPSRAGQRPPRGTRRRGRNRTAWRCTGGSGRIPRLQYCGASRRTARPQRSASVGSRVWSTARSTRRCLHRTDHRAACEPARSLAGTKVAPGARQRSGSASSGPITPFKNSWALGPICVLITGKRVRPRARSHGRCRPSASARGPSGAWCDGYTTGGSHIHNRWFRII